jgi:hypothetical protein
MRSSASQAFLIRTGRYLDYVAAGLACGLGAVLLPLLVIIVVALNFAFHAWLGQRGLEPTQLEGWAWSHAFSLAGAVLHWPLLMVLAVALVFAFVYGWWAGMHRQPLSAGCRRKSNQSVRETGASRFPK